MKTFTDYILEKQNFIFGGKAGLTGKEYGAANTFLDLKEGDRVYRTQIYFDMPGEVIRNDITQSTWELFKKEKDQGELNFTFLFVNPETDKLDIHRRNNYTLSELQDWAYDDYIVARKMARIKKVIIYSTIEISKEEAIQIAKDVYNKDTNESANFVLGGKLGLTGKEYGQGKEFAELEKGDNIYFWTFNRENKTIRREGIAYFSHAIPIKRKNKLNKLRYKCIIDVGNSETHSFSLKEDINRSIHVTYKSAMLKNHRLYSTYDMDDEDALEICKEELKI